MERGVREEKGNRRDIRISKVLPPLPPRTMAEQNWTHSSVASGHLQKLDRHGFVMAAELAACHVSEDLVLPVPTEGYVVSFVAFYEQGFDMPPHWFLRSLLQHYDLELHHLTPLGSCI
jgi:hypothetical protein